MFSPSYRSGRLKALVLVLVVVISSQPLAPILELGGARYPSVLPRNIVSSMLRSVFLDASNPARGLLPSPKLSAVAASFEDRKSTRLNSSHVAISYAVFCLKKKK